MTPLQVPVRRQDEVRDHVDELAEGTAGVADEKDLMTNLLPY